MSDFTLYDGDFGQNKVSVLPTLQEDRLIDLQMYLCPNSDNLEEMEEFILTYNYKDVVLLRDYLTSVINLYNTLNK